MYDKMCREIVLTNRNPNPYHLNVLCVAKNVTYCSKVKLEIWGKAQRESTRRPKSDGAKLGGGEISLALKSRGPNSNALAFAERTLST